MSDLMLRSQVEVLEVHHFMDGGSVGFDLLDGAGLAIQFGIDLGMQTRDERRQNFSCVGDTHPQHRGAKNLPIGGPEEASFVHGLQSWVDTQIPRDFQLDLLERRYNRQTKEENDLYLTLRVISILRKRLNPEGLAFLSSVSAGPSPNLSAISPTSKLAVARRQEAEKNERARKLEEVIERIAAELRSGWGPFISNKKHAERDNFHGYAKVVLDLLRKNSSPTNIAEYLAKMQGQSMGSPISPDQLMPVASRLCSLNISVNDEAA